MKALIKPYFDTALRYASQYPFPFMLFITFLPIITLLQIKGFILLYQKKLELVISMLTKNGFCDRHPRFSENVAWYFTKSSIIKIYVMFACWVLACLGSLAAMIYDTYLYWFVKPATAYIDGP